MGDDGVDDVGDDVLSCPGRYYCFSPTLLPTRRELKLNCSRSHQSSVLERSYSDTPPLEQPPVAAQAQMSVKPFWSSPLTCQADAAPIQLAWFYPRSSSLRTLTIPIGSAYDRRYEVSRSSDGSFVTRHSCTVGRHPVPGGGRIRPN